VVTKYFVEVIASNKQQLINLQKFELDLFQPTAKSIDDKEFKIDGLISLDDINKLVENGYKVIIKNESKKKTPAVQETTSFQEWSETAKKRQEVATRGIKRGKEETPAEGDELSESLSTFPFIGYLTSEGIDSALQYIAKSYPSLVQLIVLPERTHEGRTSRAIKISGNNTNTKNGLLFLGGVHAREILNPDLLIKFALNLCEAYTSNTGMKFENKSYSSEEIKQIVENLELFLFPLVNPDGRSFVQAPNGDVWWRKNKNPNPGLSQKGVDLNRNYDFLWDSGIGTSTNPATEIYRGKEATSEPETKNVLHLINKYQNISCVLDIHSYSQLILYPWGDDENQIEDPDMNFRNPSYDGARGHSGDSIYKEYIHKNDLDWYETTGKRIKNAIKSVRGTVYEAQPSVGLYPTSGTCDDYLHCLRYNGANRNIMGLTIETAKEFQPTYEEATETMSEVSAGLIEVCKLHLE
jgi:carboxypeptidase T